MSSVVWITGAHGFIGRHVALALEKDSVVLGIGHGHWPSSEAKCWAISEWINGDINTSNLRSLYAIAGRPKVIIHLAGGSSVGAALAQPREDFFRTVISTLELLEWLRIYSPDTSLVVASSAAVYGAGHEGPIGESVILCPYSPYGHHKLMMESLCHSYAASYGVRSVIARLFSVYGAGLQKQLMWDICTRLAGALLKIELSGTGAELRDWIDVSDVARVLVGLGPHASTAVPVFNVGSGMSKSVREIAQSIIDYWASSGDKVPELFFNGQTRTGDPYSLVADIHHLKSIGLQCLSPVQTGIKAYVDWFRGYKKVGYEWHNVEESSLLNE